MQWDVYIPYIHPYIPSSLDQCWQWSGYLVSLILTKGSFNAPSRSLFMLTCWWFGYESSFHPHCLKSTCSHPSEGIGIRYESLSIKASVCQMNTVNWLSSSDGPPSPLLVFQSDRAAMWISLRLWRGLRWDKWPPCSSTKVRFYMTPVMLYRGFLSQGVVLVTFCWGRGHPTGPTVLSSQR